MQIRGNGWELCKCLSFIVINDKHTHIKMSAVVIPYLMPDPEQKTDFRHRMGTQQTMPEVRGTCVEKAPLSRRPQRRHRDPWPQRGAASDSFFYKQSASSSCRPIYRDRPRSHPHQPHMHTPGGQHEARQGAGGRRRRGRAAKTGE